VQAADLIAGDKAGVGQSGEEPSINLVFSGLTFLMLAMSGPAATAAK